MHRAERRSGLRDDDLGLGSAKKTPWFRRLILVPFRIGRVEISLDMPQARWLRNMGHFTYLT